MPGALLDLLADGLVAEVDAVKVAEGDDGPLDLQGDPVEDLFQVGHRNASGWLEHFMGGTKAGAKR